MIFELAAVAVFIGGSGITAAGVNMYGRLPRPVYGALVSWWYGGFADNTAALMSATMLDSDLNCDAFNVGDGYGHRNQHTLFNAALRLEITVRDYGKAGVRIKCDKKGWIDVPVTAYDDYYIAKAYKAWKIRKEELAFRLTHREAANLLEYRINQNYIDMIEMIEKKILNSGVDTASELRALLPAPEHPETKPALIGPKGAQGPQADETLDAIIEELESLPTKKKPVTNTSTTKNVQAQRTRATGRKKTPTEKEFDKRLADRKERRVNPKKVIDEGYPMW